jgi:hypothetical protein
MYEPYKKLFVVLNFQKLKGLLRPRSLKTTDLVHSFFFFFFFAVLGIKLRASHMLGKHSTNIICILMYKYM